MPPCLATSARTLSKATAVALSCAGTGTVVRSFTSAKIEICAGAVLDEGHGSGGPPEPSSPASSEGVQPARAEMSRLRCAWS